jgi:plastocyanin
MRVGRIQIQRAVAIVGAGALVACLSACGSSSNANGPDYGTAPAVPAPQTPPGTAPSKIVRMRSLAFMPATLHVRVGQTVEWINDDNVVHNVTSNDGLTIKSGNFGPGHKFEFTPKQQGKNTYSITYYCTIHPTTMQATLIVLPSR